MSGLFNLGGIVELLILDLAALVTIFGYFQNQNRKRQEQTENRFSKLEDKQADLSTTCIRRDELRATLDHYFDPFRAQIGQVCSQITEVRTRLDNILTAKGD